MLDTKRFRKKYLLGLASSASTLLPMVAGVTTLLAAWTFNKHVEPALFLAVAGTLGSLGVFLTRLVLGDEAAAEEAISELKKEAYEAREEELDDLDTSLLADGDRRTEECLRDLRTLSRAFDRLRDPSSNRLPTQSAFDIASGVDELLNKCVDSLRQSLELWNTARRVTVPEARRTLLEQRERIIDDVRQSVEQLGKLLTEIQGLAVSGSSSTNLAAVRDELDQRLAVAKRVEERMQAFEREYDSRWLEASGHRDPEA